MSRKHYIEVAAVIRHERERAQMTLIGADLFGDYKLVSGSLERVADQLADVFKRDNPNFQTERFMTACGF